MYDQFEKDEYEIELYDFALQDFKNESEYVFILIIYALISVK